MRRRYLRSDSTPRWSRRVLAVAVACLVAPAARAVNLNDSYVTNTLKDDLAGYYDQQNVWSNVVALFKDAANQNCTGTLINSRTVLTAAHCLVDRNNQYSLLSYTPDYLIRFSPDPAANTTTNDRRISGGLFHPQYQLGQYDLALITLDRPVTAVTPVTLATAANAAAIVKGAAVTIVGYGLAGTGTNPGTLNDSRRRVGETAIGALDNVLKNLSAQFRNPNSPANPDVYGLSPTYPVPTLQGQPGGGDSGGPLFLKIGSQWFQIGSVIRGGSGFGATDDWVNLSLFVDWLAQNNPLRTAIAGTGALRWSAGASWTDNGLAMAAGPNNANGTFNTTTNVMTLGRYYNVLVNRNTQLSVDQNAEVDSLEINHAAAKVTVEPQSTLSTVVRTDVRAGELVINGWFLSPNLSIYPGGAYYGTGWITATVYNLGRVGPGNSPGTMEIDGSFIQGPGAYLDIEIDGTGTGDGAGNYDRLVLVNPGDTFTAGGILAPVLRDISAPASNSYSPPLGQGFQIVTAPGGVLGSFDTLEQPGAGLLPGTRFDTVYRPDAILLYATPASYANLGAAGVADNGNRRSFGLALENLRPAAGVRAADGSVKSLFDSLAPGTASALPVMVDQLAGVGYAGLVGMTLENSRFLVDQTTVAVAAHRRGEGARLTPGPVADDPAPSTGTLWGRPIGRTATWTGDAYGYKLSDTLAGFMGGFNKALIGRTQVGLTLGYAEGRPSQANNMGSGPMETWIANAHLSREFDGGLFLQGIAGGGGGRTHARRAVLDSSATAMLGSVYLNAGLTGGWAFGGKDRLHGEAGLGVNYLGLRHGGFSDQGQWDFAALRVQSGRTTSIAGTLYGRIGFPFQRSGIDWVLSGLAGVSHEFADTYATLDASLLGQPYQVRSGAIGRDRLILGVGLSGRLTKRASIQVGLSNEWASHWTATAGTVAVNMSF